MMEMGQCATGPKLDVKSHPFNLITPLVTPSRSKPPSIKVDALMLVQ